MTDRSMFVDDLLVLALKGCISDEAKEMVQQAFNVFYDEADEKAMELVSADSNNAENRKDMLATKLLDQRIGKVLWRACDI